MWLVPQEEKEKITLLKSHSGQIEMLIYLAKTGRHIISWTNGTKCNAILLCL
jgi:hypothetical protein